MPQPFADQFRSIAMSPSLAASLERAHGFAREQGHRAVTLEHLLMAFTEDPDASAVLQASNIDPVRLGTDVSGYLGRLLDDMRGMDGAEPQSDPELMRVLHAAVQAAQQSRRRQIDGAIVLAAVVGDGKSPAAGLLKAHGMTFEEAIRALQKANAKANAQARSKQFASPPPPASPPSSAAPPPVHSAPPPEPAGARSGENTGQSVEDILAAARARIQQRSTTTAASKGPEPAAEPPPAAPPELPLSALDSSRQGITSAPEPLVPEEPPHALHDASASGPPPPPPSPAQGPATAARPSRLPPAPSPERMPPAGRPGAPPQRSNNSPLPPRALEAGEGGPRPPLPPRGAVSGIGAPPLPGLPGKTGRTPWPAADGPRPLNGAHADAPLAPARRPGAGQRTGGQPGQGPLVETIPRRMRVGVASTAQVRIGRGRIDGLILLLMKGRGLAHRPEALSSRSLTVRLKAPDGGFWIEPASPETQWAEPLSSGNHQDEQITWRWNVTPQHRGRGRLVLVVMARTVGQDGLATEAATPDRLIEVTVSGGRLGRAARWIAYGSMLIVGALIGRFGGELWAIGAAMARRVLG